MAQAIQKGIGQVTRDTSQAFGLYQCPGHSGLSAHTLLQLPARDSDAVQVLGLAEMRQLIYETCRDTIRYVLETSGNRTSLTLM